MPLRIGYARVSTRDQDPEIQVKALAKVCDNVVEEKASGKRGVERSVWLELLAQLQPGDTLVVWKLDRAGRSAVDLLNTVTMLDDRGIGFEVLTGGFSTTTREGRLFLGMLAVFAEFERELILERTAEGRQKRIDAGLHPGGPRMYGFAADHETIIDAEAARLREAARHVLGDGRIGQLTDAWNRRGVPTASGKGQWRDATLRDMLLNPRVAPIVGVDTYERLVAKLDRGNAQQGRPPAALLTGIVYCGGCGAKMYAGHVAGHKAAYVCKSPHTSSGYRGCGKVSITRKGLERLVVGTFMDAVAGPTFEERRALRLKELIGDTVSPTVLDAWRADLEELRFIVGTKFATQAQLAMYDDLQAKVADASRRLLAQPAADVLASLPTAADKLRAEWERWTDDERRRALQAVLDRVTVHPATLGKRQGSKLDAGRVTPTWRL